MPVGLGGAIEGGLLNWLPSGFGAWDVYAPVCR